MKLLFAGTSDFAVAGLISLATSGHEIAAVITRPDAPAGRGRRATPSPVRQAAEQRGLTVRTPPNINDVDEVAALAALSPDLMVVAAYGRILGAPLLSLPRRGCVNVHGSLLPAWRGAAPVAHALLAGDGVTGVTLMQMDEGLDTGPILAAAATPISADDHRGELTRRLGVLGAELLEKTLPRLDEGTIVPVAQDSAGATMAPPLRKADGLLDWAAGAEAVLRRVRAFTPEPGAFTYLEGQRLLVRAVSVLPRRESGLAVEARPGILSSPLKNLGVAVCCGEGPAILLKRVQLAGKKEMDAEAAARGRQLPSGTLLGAPPVR